MSLTAALIVLSSDCPPEGGEGRGSALLLSLLDSRFIFFSSLTIEGKKLVSKMTRKSVLVAAAAVVVICHGSVEHFLANDFRRRRTATGRLRVRPTATPSQRYFLQLLAIENPANLQKCIYHDPSTKHDE